MRQLLLLGLLAVLPAARAADAPKPPAKTAKALSPRELLKQKAAALSADPSNGALRREILALALRVKPPLDVPAAVDEEFGRAEYAMKEAKAPADFAAAAKAFQKAVDLAPWSPDYYFNLAVAHEKAGAAAAAIDAFELYLTGSPQAKDAREVRRRIGGLRMQAEKDAAEASAQAQKAAGEAQRKGWAESIAAELNRIYASARFKKMISCGQDGAGCNKSERAGSNWQTFIPNDAQPVSFRANASGELELYTTFSDPEFVGVPRSASRSEVKWRMAGGGGKPAYLDLYDSGTSYGITWGTDESPDNKPYERFHSAIYYIK
jgi:hypothetical protein